MDRRYPLEAQLLARSHDSSKVAELLQQRYAVNDKPTLSLRPTEAEQKKSQRSLIATIKHQKTTHKLQKRNDMTKFVFKRYIKQSIRAQKVLKHKIAQLKKAGHEDIDITQLKEYRKCPQFDHFLQLNSLWIKYIQDLLQITQENVDKTLMQQTLSKLSSADFNGCFLNVIKSKNKQLVNKAGIVIWDAKNFFIIVQEQGGLKMIEKKGSVFHFVIPLYDLHSEDIEDNDDNYMEFSIIGSRFQYRAADRAGRKFKSRNVDDLEF